MPNWRKLIVSGSNASLNNIAATGTISCAGITGSLDTGIVRGGVYTPTYTAVSGISTLTGEDCNYIRVGDVVSVSGVAAIDATSTQSTVTFNLTLPFPSTFTKFFDLSGAGGGLASSVVTVEADTTNNEALVSVRIGQVLSTTAYFVFLYRISNPV